MLYIGIIHCHVADTVFAICRTLVCRLPSSKLLEVPCFFFLANAYIDHHVLIIVVKVNSGICDLRPKETSAVQK